jgi:transcriptional regulator with XRE-family HTH domain
MSHAAHCNHSYHQSANHSFAHLCNDGYMETLGQRIKRLREQRGLSQQQLATASGVSRVAVTKWESGQTANLKLGSLLSICELFRVSAEELIRGERATRASSHDAGADASGSEAPELMVRYAGATDACRALVDLALRGREPMPEWANKSIGRHLQSLLDDINEAMPDEKRQASHKAA